MMLPRLPDVSFNYQIFGEMGTKIVPPQKYKPMLLVKFGNLNMKMYDNQT